MSGWRILPLQDGLGAHAAEWDALNQRAFGHHPLLTSAFVGGLLRNFSAGSEFLGRLEEDGQVKAMCVLRRKNALQWASFLPAQGQLGATLIPDAAMVPTLLDSLPAAVAQLDLLCNDPEVGGVVATTQPGANRLNHALTIKVELSGTFDAYWAGRSKQLRANFKRYEKRLLAERLTQRFVHIDSPAHIAAAVDRYAALEGVGWKGKSGTSLGSAPAQLQFYRDLMLRAAECGNATVQELWFDDELAASRLLLSQDNMIVILKTSYDERFAAYAPGRLLLRYVLERAFAAKPGGTVEFYTDANADQLSWATAERWIRHATLYRWPLGHELVRAVRAAGPLRGSGPTGVAHRGAIRNDSLLQVETYRHPNQLPEPVQRFLADAGQRNIAFGADWYRNLVDTVYPDDGGVRFYALFKNGKVVAFLPLRAIRERGGWKLTALSNFYTTLYEPLLDRATRGAELVHILAAVEREFPSFASLRLSPMDPGSDAYQVLMEALRIQNWLPFEYFSFGNWYQPVTSNWVDYLAARSGTLRSTIKRMTKKLDVDGGKLEILTDSKEIARGIAAYSEVYAASWKRPEEFPAFMPGLLKYCADQGFLRLGLAWLKDQPIAAQMWIVAHGRAEIYKVAYHESFKPYAPGTLVTAMLMKHVLEQDKVSEVDYLIGDDAYKKTWMSHRRERWGIIAYNPRSLRGLGGFAYELLGRVVNAARRRYWTRGALAAPTKRAGK